MALLFRRMKKLHAKVGWISEKRPIMCVGFQDFGTALSIPAAVS
jgi:hypothetical protein